MYRTITHCISEKPRTYTFFCEIVHRVIAIGGKFVYHIVNVQNRAYYEDRI